MFKILICDDNETILNQITKLIQLWSIENNIEFSIDKKTSGDFILEQPAYYDIAFVDVEMPGINGLKLAELLQNNNQDILIIVVTSFQNYLDEAMRVHVFRYLSKPIDANRFKNNFREAVIETKNINSSIIVDLKDEVHIVKTKDILYIENLKYGSKIVTKTSEYITNKKPNEWYNEINQPNSFVYSHNSILVNLQNVINFDKTSVSLKKNNTETITTYVSQRKFKSFKKAFFDFAGGLR